jgi:hypothetical protein
LGLVQRAIGDDFCAAMLASLLILGIVSHVNSALAKSTTANNEPLHRCDARRRWQRWRVERGKHQTD